MAVNRDMVIDLQNRGDGTSSDQNSPPKARASSNKKNSVEKQLVLIKIYGRELSLWLSEDDRATVRQIQGFGGLEPAPREWCHQLLLEHCHTAMRIAYDGKYNVNINHPLFDLALGNLERLATNNEQLRKTQEYQYFQYLKMLRNQISQPHSDPNLTKAFKIICRIELAIQKALFSPENKKKAYEAANIQLKTLTGGFEPASSPSFSENMQETADEVVDTHLDIALQQAESLSSPEPDEKKFSQICVELSSSENGDNGKIATSLLIGLSALTKACLGGALIAFAFMTLPAVPFSLLLAVGGLACLGLGIRDAKILSDEVDDINEMERNQDTTVTELKILNTHCNSFFRPNQNSEAAHGKAAKPVSREYTL